jgi:hypothetical protein
MSLGGPGLSVACSGQCLYEGIVWAGLAGKSTGASQVGKNQRPVGRPKKASLDMNMINTAFLLRLSPGAELRLILMLFLFPAEWGAALSIVVLFLDIKRALSGRKIERGGRHP